MKSVSFILLGMLLLIFTCCRGSRYTNKYSFGKREFELTNLRKNLQDSVLFKSFVIIPLEASTKKYIGQINRIYFDKNTLFMLDKNFETVNIYDYSGRIVKTIEKHDLNSQKYRRLADICIDKVNKELLLLSSDPSKILYYSYQGDFLREKILPTYFESIVTDGRFIYLLDNNVINGEKELTVYDRNLIKKREFLKVKHQFKGHEIDEYPSFIYGNLMTQDVNIHITKKNDNKIYTVDNGKLYTEYVLNFKERSLPPKLLNNKMRPSNFFKVCKENDYIAFITDVIENSKYLVFNTNVGFCVCNKQNKTITKYNHIIDPLTNVVVNDIQMVGNTNDKMAVVWSLNHIKSLIAQHLKVSVVKKNMEFYKQLIRLDDKYNAVLVMYCF